MLGEDQSADFVFKLARANKQRVFPAGAGDGTSAAERLRSDLILSLHHKPKFFINPREPVFTIGSCFARNIELALASKKVECVTAQCVFPDEFYELTGVGARNGALNAYTIGSMLDLVKLPDRSDADVAGTLQVSDDEWADMMMSGLRLFTAEEQKFARGKLLDVYRNISKARTFIITLGYVEAWKDTRDNMYVNRPPAGSIKLARQAARYRFRKMNYADSIGALVELIELINRKTNQAAKIVITVSPVPLTSTFSDEDVIVANDFSKATLLTAAREVVSKFDNCDYFPSYQLVTQAARDVVWDADGAHVQMAYVRKIIEKFSELYFQG